MKFIYFFFSALVGALIFLSLIYLRNECLYWFLSPTDQVILRKEHKELHTFQNLQYHLVDPNQAPEKIREAVLQGYAIMLDTPKHASEYTGNALSCTNCHFAAGNTMGGKNGSISLAGIAAAYPSYNARSKSIISLGERINGCFMRSMNGKALPLNSDEMDAIITYLHWISKGFPIYEEVPWRGLTPIESNHTPDAKHGEAIYAAKCALCHGKNGEGQIRIPPLWGDGSFNDGAGMYQLSTLAAFIYANMPYEEPSLTEEEALDVAAYIREKPRPKFNPHN